MPGNWLTIETNFPTFTGEESSKEQVNALMNFIQILVEQLRYSLNNLDTTNFNVSALNNLKDDTTSDLAESLVTMSAQISQISQNVSRLQSRVSSVENLENRVSDLEDDVEALQTATSTLSLGYASLAKAVEQLQTDVSNHDTAITQLQKDVGNMSSDLEALFTSVQLDEDGNIYIGVKEKQTRIIGDIYFNGLPFIMNNDSGGDDTT